MEKGRIIFKIRIKKYNRMENPFVAFIDDNHQKVSTGRQTMRDMVDWIRTQIS